MERTIQAPFTKETAESLKAGDYVYIDGIIYTARDAAHKRRYGNLLHGSFSGKRRQGDRLGRPHYIKQDGQIYPPSS